MTLPYHSPIPGLAADSAIGPARAMAGLINQARSLAGVPLLAWRDDVAHAAQSRADDMVARDYFSHKTPEGRTGYVEALAAEGLPGYAWAGENLALNNYTGNEALTEAMAALEASPTHHSNNLDVDFTAIGVGYAEYPDGRHVWAIIFTGGL